MFEVFEAEKRPKVHNALANTAWALITLLTAHRVATGPDNGTTLYCTEE